MDFARAQHDRARSACVEVGCATRPPVWPQAASRQAGARPKSARWCSLVHCRGVFRWQLSGNYPGQLPPRAPRPSGSATTCRQSHHQCHTTKKVGDSCLVEALAGRDCPSRRHFQAIPQWTAPTIFVTYSKNLNPFPTPENGRTSVHALVASPALVRASGPRSYSQGPGP